MNKILVIGSTNMDYTIYCDNFPSDGETIYGNKRIVQPGGKGANQAAAAAKSKLAEVSFISSRGEDNDGESIEGILKGLGINTIYKINKDIETGNATIDVNANGENKIIIIAGANGKLEPNDIDEKIVKENDIVIIQNEIKAETNAYILKLAHKHNKLTIYNPAPYRDIDDEMFKYVDYLIVNVPELASYSKCEDVNKGIEILLNKGVKNLIVTLGSKGSMFSNKETTFKVDAYKVKAVDTVAAGDTFIGYFAASLAKGYNNKKAMDIASKASSITVTRQGSIISIPDGEELL